MRGAAAAMSNTNIPAAIKTFILGKYPVIFTMPFIPSVTLLVDPSPLCDLQKYRWGRGAEHPLELQQSQAEGNGGGKKRENDKHEHGGSWGQLKIAQRRGGAREGQSAGRALRKTKAGLFLVVLRMNCFAVGTNRKNVSYSWVHFPSLK